MEYIQNSGGWGGLLKGGNFEELEIRLLVRYVVEK
jgi:hypothetical protein